MKGESTMLIVCHLCFCSKNSTDYGYESTTKKNRTVKTGKGIVI